MRNDFALTTEYLSYLRGGVKPSIHQVARHLRYNATEAEQKLWSLLRGKQLLGKKFRRQHIFEDFLVDFYCHPLKLAIELDDVSDPPTEPNLEERRKLEYLNKKGITILRIREEEVLKSPGKVLQKIVDCF